MLPVLSSGQVGLYQPSSTTDPQFSTVMLLLHGEGSNGSTTFTDSSSYARTVTRTAGTATIATAQAKFGTASINGAGASCRLTCSMGAEFTGKEWTFECWFRRNTATTGLVWGLCYFSSNSVVILNDTNFKLQYIRSGSLAIESTNALQQDTWHHVAVTCTAGSGSNREMKMFIDGVQEGSLTTTDVNVDLPGASTFEIGRRDGTGFAGLAAYVDEYRISKFCRYTGAFTPPSAAFPDA